MITEQGISDFFMICGTFFCVVATIGILRLPDVFLRIHASTKASTLGVICISLAICIKFWSEENSSSIITKSLLVIVFLFLTAPVSAHLLGRAAKKRKNQLCRQTIIDEFGN